MDHQILLAFNFNFSVVFNCQSEVSRVEEGNTGTAVVEKIASDIKFFLVEEQRSNVVLNETVLFEVCIFCWSLFTRMV